MLLMLPTEQFDFNYQPNFLLPEGIINTIDWYIDNLEWVKSKATN